MPAKELGRVIDLLKQRWEFTPNIEITMECNPDTLTLQSLEEYRAIGINRISMGMQSANSSVLKVLDRTHNPENVSKSVENARKAGFENVSLDLIYGTPGETLEQWEDSVKTALSYGIDHISAYALIVENGTKLAAQIKRGELTMPNDDLMADMYLLVDQMCSAAGLEWYELSNWAKFGKECLHNIAYWKSANWWGLGPGAHSHVDRKRFWNVKHPTAYKQKLFAGQSPIGDSEELTSEQLHDESIMLAIRMRSGLSLSLLSDAAKDNLAGYKSSGHLEIVGGAIQLTARGRLIADRLVQEALA